MKKVKRIKCTYEELEDFVRNKVYDKDKLIVQVRDRKYIRYMKIIDINDTNIQLKKQYHILSKGSIKKIVPFSYNVIKIQINIKE